MAFTISRIMLELLKSGFLSSHSHKEELIFEMLKTWLMSAQKKFNLRQKALQVTSWSLLFQFCLVAPLTKLP